MTFRATGPGKTNTDGNKILLYNFDIDGAIVKSEHRATLQRDVVPKLKAGQGFEIIGMADRLGDAAYNRTLSQKRIKAVVDVLRSLVSPTLSPSLEAFSGETSAEQAGDADGSTDEKFRGVLIRIVDEPAPQKRIIDLIFRFRGDKDIGSLTEEEVFSQILVDISTEYKKKPNRKLHRAGLKGHKFGADTVDSRKRVLAEAQKALQGGELGVCIVIGSSAGGRDALLFQSELAEAKIRVNFLTLANTATFPPECIPHSFPPGKVPIPTFVKGPTVSALDSEHFFEAKGNGSKEPFHLDFGKRKIYASTMFADEIHGIVNGVARNINFTHKCTKTDADELHKEVIDLAEPEMMKSVIKILNDA